jgi:phosphatidylglycerol:prolipoprotein diacylglycerol transferase
MCFADTVAPFLALAQAIGRLGNYFNQELYGAPTNLPWAITIDPPYRLPQYAEQATYHPLFLYELIYNLFNMALLLWVDKRYFKQLRDGDIFFLYLVVYPLGRFFLEFLRLDTAMVGGLNMNQVIMAIVAIASAVILLIHHRRKPAER